MRQYIAQFRIVLSVFEVSDPTVHAAGSSDQSVGAKSHCFWSLAEMPQGAWCWTISGSGKIMHGTLELPEGSFLFLGSGKNGKAPLYLDEMSIKGSFADFNAPCVPRMHRPVSPKDVYCLSLIHI